MGRALALAGLVAIALVVSCTKIERVAGPKVIVTDTIVKVVHDTVVLPDTDDHHHKHHHHHGH